MTKVSKTKSKPRQSKPKSMPILSKLKGSNPVVLAVVAIVAIAGSYWAYYSFAATPEIASGRAGYCLDDRNNGTANGTVVQIWTCNGLPNQQWSVVGKTIQIHGKCMEAKGWGTANGTVIDLWDCNGGANQQWTFFDESLVNAHSNTCLDDTGYGNSGTAMHLYTCNGGSNQKWYQSAYAVSNGSGGGTNCNLSDSAGNKQGDFCAQAYAWAAFPFYGWNVSTMAYVSPGKYNFGSGNLSYQTCLKDLWNHESGWQWYADNPSSGAYGIPQSYPGNKMAVEGSDWQTNSYTQVRWGMDYIKNTSKAGNADYVNGVHVTNPCLALAYENENNSY
jgi:hypothetical protein